MCIMDASVTNGARMVHLQLRVIPRSRWMLGILCRCIGSIIIQKVGFLATSLRLVISSIPVSLLSSLPLLVIGGRLIRKVPQNIDFSLEKNRSQGQNRCGLHRWWVVGMES